MNGGKDIKLGDDKRPVSIVPSNEQNLYNISNGELLTDEFGNPLITEVDTYYLPDATAKRSTSVVVPTKESAFTRPIYVSRGSATVQYADLDVHVNERVLQRSGSTVVVGLTVLERGKGISGQIDRSRPAPIRSVIIPIPKEASTVPNKFPTPPRTTTIKQPTI